ncbi:hypothetical protein ACQEUU_20740 [Nonomuraea sp. CA-218870]|uniref:hypothetical protein n=1 Tax=Nonomuraea sp. CA-218870 TaxID=3239998 RepID=UPI003D9206C6
MNATPAPPPRALNERRARRILTDWLQTRACLKGASSTAVFLNHRGGRLTDRADGDIITGLGETCGINDDPTERITEQGSGFASGGGQGQRNVTQSYFAPGDADPSAGPRTRWRPTTG